MPSWTELAPFALLGLFGSLHCAGMCGGFAVAVALSCGERRRRALVDSLVYVLGKALSYAVLGLLAARAGWLLTHGSASLLGDSPGEHAVLFERARAVLAWVMGITFVLFALSAVGVPVLSRFLPGAASTHEPRFLRLLFDGARSLPSHTRALALGIANGLMPCGLSWAALALAAGGGELRAAAGLFLFGLATAPVLLVVGLGGASIPAHVRTRVLRFAAPLILVFGVVTIARAGSPAFAALDGVVPECCQHARADWSP